MKEGREKGESEGGEGEGGEGEGGGVKRGRCALVTTLR